jgi:hypothetical protein
MLFRFVYPSSNKKTGPIAVITADRSTCPKTCPFLGNGCYAEQPPLRWKWDKLSRDKKGITLEELLDKMRGLRKGTIVRYGDAGDLPGNGTRIDRDAVLALADTAKENKLILFGYTHYLTTPKKDRRYNIRVIKEAISRGFHINISVESIKEAKKYSRMKLPVAAVFIGKEDLKKYSMAGVKIKRCVATTKNASCWSCGNVPYCAQTKRVAAVGFQVHGSYATKRRAISVIRSKR